MYNKDDELIRIEAQKSVDDLADTIQELAVIFAKSFHTPEQRKLLNMIDDFRRQKLNRFWISEVKASRYKKIDASFLDEELI